jgi:hypothetical protein
MGQPKGGSWVSTIRRFLPITQAYWTSRVQFSGIEVVGHEARLDPARRPHARPLHALDFVVTARAVCRPDLLTDGPARAVARLLTDAAHVDHDEVAGLVAAVEAYDLATARVQWCRECNPDPVHTQVDALQWHEREQHQAYVAMLATLRQSTGSDHLAS